MSHSLRPCSASSCFQTWSHGWSIKPVFSYLSSLYAIQSHKTITSLGSNLDLVSNSFICQDSHNLCIFGGKPNLIFFSTTLITKMLHLRLFKLPQLLLLWEERNDFVVKLKCSVSGGVLAVLLRKKELLNSEDLVLDWQQLYKLYEKNVFSHYEQLGMMHYPP